MSWTLVVAYPGAEYLQDGDETIHRAVGQRSHSTSMGRGARRLYFEFATPALARAAGQRAGQALADTRVRLHDDARPLREGWERVEC